MGKAIYGAIGGPDPRMVAELATLRARVRALEAELSEYRDAHRGDLTQHDLDLQLLASPDTALV
jgi:hypothetical protein